MSKPIVWSGDIAEIDGVMVYQWPMGAGWWSVCADQPYVEVKFYAGDTDRDLAARAVVAAVRVLRGETDAAEREKHAELIGLLLQVAPWIGGIPFHPDTVAEVAAAKRRIVEIIEGAPAPREG